MGQISILVVDDEKEIADLVEIYLVSDGYKVFKANNAQEGLEILDKEEIHLVLLDIMMPEMNGYEATRAIRALNRPDAESIPVIAMTANAFAEDVHAAMEAGMNAHVAKPVDLDVLRAALEKTLSAKEG